MHLLYASPSFMSIGDALYSLVLTSCVHSYRTCTCLIISPPRLKLTEILIVMSLEQLQWFEALPLRKIKGRILMLIDWISRASFVPCPMSNRLCFLWSQSLHGRSNNSQILSLQMKIQLKNLCWQVLLIFLDISKDTSELIGAFGDADFLAYQGISPLKSCVHFISVYCQVDVSCGYWLQQNMKSKELYSLWVLS